MTDTFTIHHLRFTAEVETTIVMDTFKGREGIMSGSPRRMADAFVEAFRKS